LRALSLRQPWAWLVLHGGKTIENRTWNTEQRGRFLIHASATMTRQEYAAARDFSRLQPNGPKKFPKADDLPMGGIVGVARLLDVLPAEQYPAESWRLPLQYGFQLGEVRELPFLACQGLQRFWSADRLRSSSPDWPGWEILDAQQTDTLGG
jgi:ASCH domain